jgi:hypothetical protein
MNQALSAGVTVVLAIIGVAIVATLVSNKAQTSQVIGAAASGFGGDLGVALSPVTGQGNNFSTTSFTGGGAGSLIHF